MLDELRRGENVQNRLLATWLAEDEYESFESVWESQQKNVVALSRRYPILTIAAY